MAEHALRWRRLDAGCEIGPFVGEISEYEDGAWHASVCLYDEGDEGVPVPVFSLVRKDVASREDAVAFVERAAELLEPFLEWRALALGA
jgi:hypothetical protein